MSSLRRDIHFPAGARQDGCIVVAEVAQSHEGSLGQAHACIDAIAAAGADAVKFQTHIAAAESTLDEPWRVEFSTQDRSRYAYWKRMEFNAEEWRELKQHAETSGLLFLSSPFSSEAVALLDRIGIAAWKVPSGEVGNASLLRELVKSSKPILLSSGMSALGELDAAVEIIRAARVPCAVLQCTSLYPCPPERVGLEQIAAFRSRYACPVGLSDHSGTIFPGLAAVALGCDILEVHLTLSREMTGPDVTSSLTPAELGQLVSGVRCIERMLASPVNKDRLAAELAPIRAIFTKSVALRADLPAGTILSLEHLTTKKPATGIPSARLSELVGRRLKRDVTADRLLAESDLELP